MKELWNVTQMAIATVGGFCGWFLGGFDGFLYALIAFAFYPAIIIVRLTDEEDLLTRELPGYAAYKQKVKYRIIPFIW